MSPTTSPTDHRGVPPREVGEVLGARPPSATTAAAETAEASAAVFEHAFRSSPVGAAVLDASGTIVAANDAMCRLLGRPQRELAGARFAEFVTVAEGTAAPGWSEVRYRGATGATTSAGLLMTAPGGPDGLHVVYLEDTSGRAPRRRLESELESYRQRLRYESAVAACANALLRGEEDADLDPALQALLEAADASTLFVEVNVDDPELGPCTSLIREVSKPGVALDQAYWALMPWSRLPDSHAALSRGEVFVMDFDQLSPEEAAVYEGVDVEAEINAPIFVEDVWVGLVGFADVVQRRDWSENEIRLLETAAQMIAAFWQKRDAREKLVAAAAAAEKRSRAEHALFEASRALLSGAAEDALAKTVDALLPATQARHGFIERNVEHPELGFCSQTVHTSALEPDGSVLHREDAYWDLMPWAALPDSRDRLSRGLPFAFAVADLGPVERATYEASPSVIRSEIDLPIFMGGEWVGLIGFSDPRPDYEWVEGDVLLLQTAADMIGAFWARQQADERLRELVRSKDEFLAAVSHELRTPLTTILGLSAELRDRPGDFPDDERQELVKLIASESNEMAGLVADLLVAARDDVDAIAMHPEPVDLAAEFGSVLAATPDAGRVVAEIDGEVMAWADPIRVRQILRNLVTNAARYGGDTVRFRAVRRGEVVVARMHDDGSPVPADERERIFEPYQRAETLGSQPSAVGLGLTVSRRLARLMGGDLRYRAEGDGNSFELVLPAAP